MFHFKIMISFFSEMRNILGVSNNNLLHNHITLYVDHLHAQTKYVQLQNLV